jgi:preprotein translocase subunit SecE
MTDKLKVFAAAIVFSSGIVGYYLLADQIMVLRVISILAGSGLSLLVFRTTTKGSELFHFLSSVLLEAKKVVWPTRAETLQMTLVVFVVVVIMAIFLTFIDITFSYLVNLILGR